MPLQLDVCLDRGDVVAEQLRRADSAADRLALMRAGRIGRLVRRWSVGFLIATLLVGVSSPWFVRSYVPREWSDRRGVLVLQPGAQYRWRSEGYATTRIGPLGMPGQGQHWRAASAPRAAVGGLPSRRRLRR
jgi:hypothetical protein